MPEHLAVFHDEHDLLKRGDVLQGIAGNRDDVGQHPRGEVADRRRLAEQLRRDDVPVLIASIGLKPAFLTRYSNSLA